MDFLGTPGVDAWSFLGLTAASLVTSVLGVSTGAAGGVILLGLMAIFLPPAVLLPIHTVVMLGSGITRATMMWRYVMREAIAPFVLGAAIGAVAGANVFVALPQWMLLLGPRRVHADRDLDAEARPGRTGARPLRGAGLRRDVPWRVRQRHRLAACAIPGELRTGPLPGWWPPWAR